MSKDQEHAHTPNPWSNQYNSQTLSDLRADPEASRLHPILTQANAQPQSPYSAPSTNHSRLPDRTNVPTRSATLNSAEPDRNLSASTYVPHARSEDFNHGSSSRSHPSGFSGPSPRAPPAFQVSGGGSRPSTPASSTNAKHSSSSGHADVLHGHSDTLHHRTSVASFSSAHSESSSYSGRGKPSPTSASSTSASLTLT